MKRVLFYISLIAIICSACDKTVVTNKVYADKTTTIEVRVDIEEGTRTYLADDGKIHWAESGEKLGIAYYADDASTAYRTTTTHDSYTITEEGRIAFTADFASVGGAHSYTLGGYCPYNGSTTPTISMALSLKQSPTADSFDPATDILLSKQPVTVQGTPTEVTFSLARLVAFAKMTLKGIGAGEIIQEVRFSSSAKPAGEVEFNILADSVLDSVEWHHTHEDIVITRPNWVATGEDAVWLTTLPTDLSGTDFRVEVVTDKGTYSKSVDLAERTLNFVRGDVALFSVSLERDSAEVSIAGNWHLTEWRGAEPSFDVYMSISEDYSVMLWQRIASRDWEIYESSANLTNGIISGTYTDGTAWSTSYSVTIDGDQMTWVDTTDPTDISVYSREALPSDLPTATVESTRSADCERFL